MTVAQIIGFPTSKFEFEKCETNQNRDREGAETERTDCGSGNRFLTGAALNKLFKNALNRRTTRPFESFDFNHVESHRRSFGRCAHANELDLGALFVHVESQDAVMRPAQFVENPSVVDLA